MATKRIVKFVLRMIVAAAVVVGGYFLIKMFVGKNSMVEDIVKESSNQNISTRYQDSYDGMIDYSIDGSTQRTKIFYVNKISNFLIEYYNHYITLSVYDNKDNNTLKNDVIKNIQALSENITITTNHLKTLKTTNTQDPAYAQEQQERLILVANDYFEQVKQFFKLNEALKNYVFETNYSSKMLTAYEIKLEIVKDYAKYVFDNEIYGKFNEPNGNAIKSTNETSFSVLLDNFNNRQTLNRNGDKEVKVLLRYQSIDKETLNEYFSHTNDKEEYINSITNESLKIALGFLNDFIKEGNF